MKVSVAITTYNQEDYIAQTLESVLMQQADFDYEIVVSDDGSSDDTPKILEEYEKKLGRQRLRLRLHKVNQGLLGKINFIQNIMRCSGKYIALLDGDDYWIDERKLEKQAELLDANPDLALCFSGYQVQKVGQAPIVVRPPGARPVYKLNELVEGNFIMTGTTVFRRGLFGPFPDWYYSKVMGDWCLHILNAQYGDIGYIDDVTAFYRTEGQGLSARDRGTFLRRQGIATIRVLKTVLDSRYHRPLNRCAASKWLSLSLIYAREREPLKALTSFWRGLLLVHFRPKEPFRRLLFVFLASHLPGFIQVWDDRARRRDSRRDPEVAA